MKATQYGQGTRQPTAPATSTPALPGNDHPAPSRQRPQGHIGLSGNLARAPRKPNEGGQARAGASTETPDQLAMGLQQMSLGHAIPNRTAPRQLDHRNNVVEATRRESSWATQVWKQANPAQIQEFVNHLHELVGIGRYYQQEMIKLLPTMAPAEAAARMARFGHIDAVEQSLTEWSGTNRSGRDLAQRLLDNRDFKQLLDLVGELQETVAPQLRNAIRSPLFFTDRGRQLLPEDQVRQSSLMNRHAGITDGLHRRPSTEDFFSKEIEHAKADYERVPSSATSTRFGQSGTPFIGGVSGSAQFIVQHMEMQCPFQRRPPHQQAQMERLLLMHAALMTAGGHHSVMETLLPARILGFFADVPNPLLKGGSYTESMRVLGARAQQLGLHTQTRLG